MACSERDNLVRILGNAVLAYSDAVRSMSGAEGEAFQRARKWADTLHTICEDCREVLAAHERNCGCGSKVTAKISLQRPIAERPLEQRRTSGGRASRSVTDADVSQHEVLPARAEWVEGARTGPSGFFEAA
jgi:hypothetical protein